MKIQQLDPNSVHFIESTDDHGRVFKTCNLAANKKVYPTPDGYIDEKGNQVEDFQDFFGKAYLEANKSVIQRQIHKFNENREANDNQLYLKWKRSISKNSLWDKVKIFFKNLFRKDKKYYL